MSNKPVWIITHHTGGSDTDPLSDSSNFTFEQCNELHKEKFNMKSSLGFYVGYHYYISKDGTVKQARADTDEGAHTIGYNTQSLGVCLAGNFDLTLPTKAQVDSLTKLLQEKSKFYSLTPEFILPHRRFANKTCYGKNLADNWASKLSMTKEQKIKKASKLLLEAMDLIKEMS